MKPSTRINQILIEHEVYEIHNNETLEKVVMALIQYLDEQHTINHPKEGE